MIGWRTTIFQYIFPSSETVQNKKYTIFPLPHANKLMALFHNKIADLNLPSYPKAHKPTPIPRGRGKSGNFYDPDYETVLCLFGSRNLLICACLSRTNVTALSLIRRYLSLNVPDSSVTRGRPNLVL